MELEIDKKDADMKKLLATSWMVPVLAQWMAALNHDEPYVHLVRLQAEVLKETNFQLWYPDENTDGQMYRGPAYLESGIAEAPIELPTTAEEMRELMRKTRSDSPVKELKTSSAGKAGIGWLDYVANRHFRTPTDPAFWQGLRVNGG